MIDLRETFEKYHDDFLKFDKVENPLHPRSDICAFLLLDKLLPDPGRGIIGNADHEVIYLGVSTNALAEVATEEDILTLTRCGVMYDNENECLSMFV